MGLCGLRQIVRRGLLFRVRKRGRASLGVEILRLTGPKAEDTWQSVISANYDLTDEKSISCRLVAGTRGTNFSAGYRQAVRRGMDVYLLFGDPNEEKTQSRVILKLIVPYSL